MEFVVENGVLIKFINPEKKQDILIPDNITTISSSVFYKCFYLRSVVIPHGVKRIEAFAFAACKNLTHVYFPKTIEYIHENAFESTPWLDDYPSDFVVICNILYKYKGQNNSIIIPDNVNQINSCAFQNDKSIVEIVISESVKKIDNFGFFQCQKLQSITIPETVKDIGRYVFAECNELQYVNILGHCSPHALFETASVDSHTIQYNPASNPQEIYAPHIYLKDCLYEHTRLLFINGFAGAYLQKRHVDEDVLKANKEYIVTHKDQLAEIADSYRYLFTYMITEDLIPVTDITLALSKIEDISLKTLILDYVNKTRQQNNISDLLDNEYNLDDD